MHKDASNNTVLDSFTFTLDTEGNISQVLHADGTKWVYTYDQRHRVTEGDLRDSGNNNVRTFGYAYDVANNLTTKTATVISPYSQATSVFAYNDANEQTSMTVNGGTPETRTYDGWGRLATRTQGTSSATYGYRYGGRLYSLATNFGGETAETMQYRGDGRLYSRTTAGSTKIYRYDRGWNAINEEDGTGYLVGTSIYAPGAEVGERLAYSFGLFSNTPIAYAYHDQLGSTRVWRWGNKNLVGKDDFGPYGEKIASCDVLPRDYALHVNDPNALLFHAPYRDYAAGWGRWTTRDPLGMVDGPNEYAYVGDRPVYLSDPMGLSCAPEVAGVIAQCGFSFVLIYTTTWTCVTCALCLGGCAATGGAGCALCAIPCLSCVVSVAAGLSNWSACNTGPCSRAIIALDKCTHSD